MHVVPSDPLVSDDAKAVVETYRAVVPSVRKKKLDDPTANYGCGAAAADPVPDGEPIVVSLPPGPNFTVGSIPASSWRNPPETDATWKMNYLGLMWMKGLARRAAIDDQQQSLQALVDQAVKYYQQNPDPGTAVDGWDEGTALRRLESMNCLYALTQAEVLRPGMTSDANVLLSARYYGPPNFPVHNHGLMANLQLVRASVLLGVANWKSTAIRRLTDEAPQVFSSLGVSWEQSSSYQNVNALGWKLAADVLRESGETSAADNIMVTVAKAKTAWEWMTEPDGKIVQIGDSDEEPGATSTLTTPRNFRDDQTGWAIGRWSWTDPQAAYYSVRYGPARRAHGQHDRAGGVTYSVKGVRVLVNPGRFSNDRTENYNLYGLSPQSHNVALPDDPEVTNNGGSITAATITGPAHAYAVSDTMFGIAHTRDINVNRDTATMRVTDNFPAKDLWRQYWHLDPAWTVVSAPLNGTQLVFSHPSGRRLTITTTGRTSSIVQGITRPPAGWHFPEFGVRVWNNEIVLRSYGRASVTTFTVS
ncbi:heparinase II/III family protein [Actinoplanes sp. NBRC 103695]|uniref:heparinase II/III domain-containing protein n=1 Tax=Actinoplanes sp. NBRC 103695 TaxID=3032202 RepID=UPI0024A5EDF8|nr:heparinase II/III family protein [Actinoplanes sp. NBRC 103695]GLY95535.1 hypothetical protein Acsp02_27900 [Actinoplanes sp. NBRC 103695]